MSKNKARVLGQIKTGIAPTPEGRGYWYLKSESGDKYFIVPGCAIAGLTEGMDVEGVLVSGIPYKGMLPAWCPHEITSLITDLKVEQ